MTNITITEERKRIADLVCAVLHKSTSEFKLSEAKRITDVIMAYGQKKQLQSIGEANNYNDYEEIDGVLPSLLHHFRVKPEVETYYEAWSIDGLYFHNRDEDHDSIEDLKKFMESTYPDIKRYNIKKFTGEVTEEVISE